MRRWEVWVLAMSEETNEVVTEILKGRYWFKRTAEWFAPLNLPATPIQLALHIHHGIYLTYEIREVNVT